MWFVKKVGLLSILWYGTFNIIAHQCTYKFFWVRLMHIEVHQSNQNANCNNWLFTLIIHIVVKPNYSDKKIWQQRLVCMTRTYLQPHYNALRQWGFGQCLPFNWTTLRGKHWWHPIAVMEVVVTFGQFDQGSPIGSYLSIFLVILLCSGIHLGFGQ